MNKNTDGYDIYGMIDPITNEMRYIGYSYDIVKRLSKHCAPSSLRGSNHKQNWIKKVIAQERKPIMIVLEHHNTLVEAKAAEIELIAYYRYIGCDLTNSTEGGDGGFIVPVTDEKRKKMSAAHMGVKRGPHSAAHKKKISNAVSGENNGMFGKTPSQDQIDQCAKLGRQYRKLSLDQANDIRRLYATNEYTHKQLSKIFGVSPRTIQLIVTNMSYVD